MYTKAGLPLVNLSLHLEEVTEEVPPVEAAGGNRGPRGDAARAGDPC